MQTATAGREAGLGRRAAPPPSEGWTRWPLKGGGSARPGWARGFGPGRGDPRCASCSGCSAASAPGRAAPLPPSDAQATSQTSLSGGGGAPRTRPAQRLSWPHKGGPTCPAPPSPRTFLLFRKRNAHPGAPRGAGLRGCRRGNFAVSARAPGARGRLSSAAGTPGAPPSPPGAGGRGHSPDFRTCGGIVLAMRVHRTMCSGHRPRSSPRPMAAPAARHRPSPERSGRRLPEPRLRPRAAPSRDPAPAGRADARARCGAARQPGGGLEAGGARGGPRRPRGAAQEAGSCPRRVRARGCRRSVRASDSLNFARAPRGKQETPRQQLGRTSRRPRAFSLRSAFSPRSPSCLPITSLRPAPPRALANFQLPPPPSGVAGSERLPPRVTKGTRLRK